MPPVNLCLKNHLAVPITHYTQKRFKIQIKYVAFAQLVLYN